MGFQKLRDYNVAVITCDKCKKEERVVVDGESLSDVLEEACKGVNNLGWRAVHNGEKLYCSYCPNCWEEMSNTIPFEMQADNNMNEIEKMFAQAICAACNVPSLRWIPSEEEHCLSLCEPQKPMGIYIVDFYMEDACNNKYVVEIDGHEAHKTKQQRYEDYVRERWLQKQNITVIRFMGSEIFVDADKCAKECLEIIDEYAENKSNIELQSFEAGLKCVSKSA